MGILSMGAKLADLDELESKLRELREIYRTNDLENAGFHVLVKIDKWLAEMPARRESVESGWD